MATRSYRLPSAPPMMSAMPTQKKRLPPRFSSHSMKAHAIDAIAMKSQRCQPSAPAKKLNAAPELKASTRLKNDVTGHSSPGLKFVRTAYFVS